VQLLKLYSNRHINQVNSYEEQTFNPLNETVDIFIFYKAPINTGSPLPPISPPQYSPEKKITTTPPGYARLDDEIFIKKRDTPPGYTRDEDLFIRNQTPKKISFEDEPLSSPLSPDISDELIINDRFNMMNISRGEEEEEDEMIRGPRKHLPEEEDSFLFRTPSISTPVTDKSYDLRYSPLTDDTSEKINFSDDDRGEFQLLKDDSYSPLSFSDDDDGSRPYNKFDDSTGNHHHHQNTYPRHPSSNMPPRQHGVHFAHNTNYGYGYPSLPFAMGYSHHQEQHNQEQHYQEDGGSF